MADRRMAPWKSVPGALPLSPADIRCLFAALDQEYDEGSVTVRGVMRRRRTSSVRSSHEGLDRLAAEGLISKVPNTAGTMRCRVRIVA